MRWLAESRKPTGKKAPRPPRRTEAKVGTPEKNGEASRRPELRRAAIVTLSGSTT